MKHGVDVVFLQMLQQPGANGCGFHDDIEHVRIVLATGRGLRQAQMSGVGQWLEAGGIAGVNGVPLPGDFIGLFELGVEEGGDEFRRQIRGAEIHPRVFVHLATEELGAVGTLFSEDFRAFHKARVIDDQGAAFAADEVFGLVEAVAAKVSDGAEILAVEGGVDPLGGVLDDQ